ncbi:hypothetical protein [Oceanomicrobium pacificus]|uniref:Pilus assembly protein n=1 Tax=Oceanomicrobium pacificus TaxID=2692916 RepID=A0A6B0TRK6_9RHOB|nr:hypothetical protein [Oceanomicrobium pacificus]MXU65339.1 hypothetical protein [Oceanomicrobium pacificus]
MSKHFAAFLDDTSGAVTVDWVVLTAALVGIAIPVIVIVSEGINVQANNADDTVSTAHSLKALVTSD